MMSSVSSASIADAFALLAVIADPKAAKAALDDLRKAKDEAVAQQDVVAQARLEAQQMRADAQATATEFDKRREDLDARLQKAVDAEAKAYAAQQAQKDARAAWDAEQTVRETAVVDRAAELDRREAALNKADVSLKAREAALVAADTELAQSIDAHNREVAALAQRSAAIAGAARQMAEITGAG